MPDEGDAASYASGRAKHAMTNAVATVLQLLDQLCLLFNMEVFYSAIHKDFAHVISVTEVRHYS